MERGLRRAVERDELLLHYQPQVDLRTGRMVGVEALMRWNHPERGMIPPNHFIPIAEETGLIMPMGEWALRIACTQAVQWMNQGNELIMAVNISARQFNHPGLVAMVEQVLRDTGLPAHWLELELTESVAMQDVQRTTATLHALRDLGVLLSIDDFGTGFSSLSYLQRFPLNKLKVDRSFVNNLGNGHNDTTIAQTVILLGHSLRLRVIAEGVETREQIEILRGYGCEEMQGFYFSRPIPAHEIGVLLKEGRLLAA
jgi:EAL domain-containing protein (putative c-di-GMP-specific phosphodiesterase class I)